MKLTKSAIANLKLPASKTESIIFDDEIPGFGIRLRAGGSRVWIFQYKVGSKQRRMTLGKFPALDPIRAREAASLLHAKVRLGQDPAGAKAESRTRAEETFGACVKTYLAWQRARTRPSTFRDIERHLVKNLAALHSLRIDKIDRRAIAAQLAQMADRPVQANRTRASLSKFLNWAAGEGVVETNAALLTNKHAEKSRDRVLSEAEIRAVWCALPDGDYGDIVRLLLLTGQREREISELSWAEVDLARGLIALPAARTKNHRPHIVPVTPMARAILEARPRSERALVFGTGAGGFSGWSRAKERLDQAADIAPWRIHDLRRTFATHCAELGIPPHIIEAVLNHVSGARAGVAGIYNRSELAAEKAAALLRWEDRLAAMLSQHCGKVVPLRRVQGK